MDRQGYVEMAEGGARAPLVPLRQHQTQAALGASPYTPPLRPPYPGEAQYPPVPGAVAPTPAPLIRVAPTPRILVLRRSDGHGFGFTLRHFIIYPPESVTDLLHDARHAAVGAVKECMDTIFVKSIRDGGPAQRAGLRPGDRILCVDKQPIRGWPYSHVVQLIQQASNTLTLHVVPKEADVLQKYFSDVAHNPETNQRPHSRPRERRTSTGEMPLGVGVGASGPAPSVHPLYVPQVPTAYRPINTTNAKLTNEYPNHSDLQSRIIYDQRKAAQKNNVGSQSNSSERLLSHSQGVISRLTESQSQVPQQSVNRVSRRSSEGARLQAVDPTNFYASPPPSPNYSSRDSASYNSGESLQNSYKNQMASSMKAMYPSGLPVQYTNKFNYDDRRESNTSLTSSATESKDSMSSRESMSTLTGNDQDNLNLLSTRMRKSFEQKEAFLMRPCQPTGWVTPEDHNVIQQREFYARPQKLHKSVWPPLISVESPSKNKENIQTKVWNTSHGEYENHDYYDHRTDTVGDISDADSINKPNCSKQKHDKTIPFHSTLTKIQENSPTFNDSGGNITNGTTHGSLETMLQDKRYPVPSELQIVSNRMRQFESQPNEDRTALYRSELARLSTKKPEPTVALRRKEFESRGGKRDARSLDSQHSVEEAEMLQGSLSGNRIIVTGGKHLTCPPPEGYQSENEKVQIRLRSNSTGSEGLPARRTHAPDGSHMKRRLALSKEQIEALMVTAKNNGDTADPTRDIIDRQVPNGYKKVVDYPNGVDAPQNKNYKSDSDRISKRPERPTQLSLAPGEKFVFPTAGGHTGMQALGSCPTTPSSPPSQPQSPSGVSLDDGAVVVRRQKKSSDLGTEAEGAMRRVSYLKATAEQYNFDRESDGESQLLLRSDKKDRDETNDAAKTEGDESEDVTIEGNVQIKMVLTNSKKASDRSWKNARAVLQGSKLTLYRHHHQSPTAGGSSESLNLQFSMADLAGDYTKRKHVVRVTSGSDGTELLLQAGSADEASKWLHALQAQASRGQLAEPQKPLESPAEVSGLSPPPRTKKLASTRTVSPTDNSPASLTASPKSKTWKGRVARQLRRMQTGGTGTSPIGAPSNGSRPSKAVGVPLELCEPLPDHPLVPHIVGLCTRAVEERGLHVVGLYRIPGNTANVTALMESLERTPTPDVQDPKWNDVNVVSSLLKGFFRRLPNPLLTKELYPMFINADKLLENTERVHTIRRLVRGLPDHHYETLKFLMEHLKKVAAENAINKMEARNLAIVFGPTLVRSADDNMMTMVNDMSSQCRIIESLINNMEWYFDEEDRSSPVIEVVCEEELPSSNSNQALLLQNVKKIEGKMDVSTKDIVSSIISAANRKIQRKPRTKNQNTNCESSPNHVVKSRDCVDKVVTSTEELHEQQSLSPRHDSSKSYAAAIEAAHVLGSKRIEVEKRAINRREKNNTRNKMSSPITVAENSMDSLSNSSSNKVDTAGKRLKTDSAVSSDSFSDGADMVSSLTTTFDQKLRSLHSASPLDDLSIPYVDEGHDETSNFGDPSLHRSTDILDRGSEESKIHSDEKSRSETDSMKSGSSQEIIRYHEKNGDVKKAFLSDVCKKKAEKLRYGKENKSDSEKDIDINSEQSSPDDIPDNNKNAEKFFCDNKKVIVLQEVVFKKACFATDKTDIINAILAKNKLKRSESLNRSESDKAVKGEMPTKTEKCNSARLMRTESLTKNEKTETNILRRKELNYGGLNRASAKLKRKNGMPERSIKRRHTVGGTKDFDKDEWVALSCSRTSSPDLPTTITDVAVHRHISPIPLESHV